MKDALIATGVSLLYLFVAVLTTYEVAILAAVTTLVLFEINRWRKGDAQ